MAEIPKAIGVRRVRGPEALAVPTYWAEWQWDPMEDGGAAWVDFRVWSSIGTSAEGPMFSRDDPGGCSDPVSDPREATPLVSGFCKWDGCTQFSFDGDKDAIHVHFDHEREWRELCEAIVHVRRVAREIMGDNWDDASDAS